MLTLTTITSHSMNIHKVRDSHTMAHEMKWIEQNQTAQKQKKNKRKFSHIILFDIFIHKTFYLIVWKTMLIYCDSESKIKFKKREVKVKIKVDVNYWK